MAEKSLEETIREMRFDNQNQASLSIEDLAVMQPGLARLMPEVGARTWKLYYAAEARNWPLAKFQLKEAAKLLKLCGVTRPKYAKNIDHFLRQNVEVMAKALDGEDFGAFDVEFQKAVDEANVFHEVYNKGFLRWKLPSSPPPDLDMTPRPKK